MSWTDRKPFVVTKEQVNQEWGLRGSGKLHCRICKTEAVEGSIFRFVYANGTEGSRCGNFMVCEKCDKEDSELIEFLNTKIRQAESMRRAWL